MRVASLEAIPIALPPRRAVRCHGLEIEGGTLIVRLVTESGVAGFGEITPYPNVGGDHGRYAGETIGTALHLIETVLGPVVVGADIRDVEALLDRMDAALVGHFFTKAGIETAVQDARGKALGQPLFRLLGGRLRDAIPIAHTIPLMDLPDAVLEARFSVDEGARALQVKGGGDVERDCEVLRSVRAAVSDKVQIIFDANRAYEDLGRKRLVDVARRLVEAGADALEQPSSGLDELKAATDAVSVPVIADESAQGPSEVLAIAQRRAADGVSLYVAKAGGISRALRCSTLAEAAGLLWNANGAYVSGITAAATLHFATAARGLWLASVIPLSAPAGRTPTETLARYFVDDVVCEPLPYDDGCASAPTGAGLGVEVDEEKLTALAMGPPIIVRAS